MNTSRARITRRLLLPGVVVAVRLVLRPVPRGLPGTISEPTCMICDADCSKVAPRPGTPAYPSRPRPIGGPMGDGAGPSRLSGVWAELALTVARHSFDRWFVAGHQDTPSLAIMHAHHTHVALHEAARAITMLVDTVQHGSRRLDQAAP
jgi:hypothetical protein